MEAVGARGLRRRLMGSMVGGNRIDHALYERLANGLPILGGSKRRVYAPSRPGACSVVSAERQVMRRHLRRNRQSRCFGQTDQVNSGACTHVLQMKASLADSR